MSHRGLRGAIPRASFGRIRANPLFAALVLEVDTIPKPDGLGGPLQTHDSAQSSNGFEQGPRKIG